MYIKPLANSFRNHKFALNLFIYHPQASGKKTFCTHLITIILFIIFASLIHHFAQKIFTDVFDQDWEIISLFLLLFCSFSKTQSLEEIRHLRILIPCNYHLALIHTNESHTYGNNGNKKHF